MDDSPGTRVIRQTAGMNHLCLQAQPPQFRTRFGDLSLCIRPFVEQSPCASLQCGRNQWGCSNQRGDCTCRQYVEMRYLEQFLSPLDCNSDVGEFQRSYRGIEKSRLLLNRFREGEANIRKNKRQWDSWKSRSASDIENLLRIRKELPWKNTVQHMLDGGFPRAHDAGEIEMLIRFGDQLEVTSRPGDDRRAMREVSREKCLQLCLELSGRRQTIS